MYVLHDCIEYYIVWEEFGFNCIVCNFKDGCKILGRFYLKTKNSDLYENQRMTNCLLKMEQF